MSWQRPEEITFPPSERQRGLLVGTSVASRLSLILLLHRGISVERSHVKVCGVLSCQVGRLGEPCWDGGSYRRLGTRQNNLRENLLCAY